MKITPKNGNNGPVTAGMPLIFKGTVLLAGGGAIGADAYALARERSVFFVGSDGGGDAILAQGQDPVAVIGDMDSLSEAAKAVIPSDRLYRIAEQDSTDFEKALRTIRAPLILAVGFTGARLDHELAALHGLVRFADRAVILIGQEDITFHVPPRINLTLEPGLRLSLFPMDGVTMSASGLEWSFESLALHPARKIGTSNAVRQPDVSISTDGQGLLMILPREALDAAIDGLQQADLHSPQG